jgi:hypothetical protein
MKRVFSLKKFVEDRLAKGEHQKVISDAVKTWARKYDGKTKEEIRKDNESFRLILDDSWFIEV